MTTTELIHMMQVEGERFKPGFWHDVDLKDYASKLLNRAEIRFHYSEGNCQGFIAYYCNDKESRCGYISLVLVAHTAQGTGLAGELLEHVIDAMERRKFTRVRLQVDHDNPRAINFYKRHGFELVDARNDMWTMERKLSSTMGKAENTPHGTSVGEQRLQVPG
ncbi:MAG: GNAT family N-acetyltransferase [Halomonas sp.]|nr:GNAT family N-acetyltransferase [Halomonas sp.]MCC5881999.1 GNAT family N-acetyltransferase [Halomonas sp.]